MVVVRVILASDVERLDVRLATVVDEAGLVAVELGVQTQREELVFISLLNGVLLASVVVDRHVVHVKQVGETLRVIKCSTHVALLFRDHFAGILHDKSTCRNVFKCNYAPHSWPTLLIFLTAFLGFN